MDWVGIGALLFLAFAAFAIVTRKKWKSGADVVTDAVGKAMDPVKDALDEGAEKLGDALEEGRDVVVAKTEEIKANVTKDEK